MAVSSKESDRQIKGNYYNIFRRTKIMQKSVNIMATPITRVVMATPFSFLDLFQGFLLKHHKENMICILMAEDPTIHYSLTIEYIQY